MSTTGDARAISARVRDALMLLEEKERGRPATAIEELEAEGLNRIRLIEQMIDSMSRRKRLWTAAGMPAMIADTKNKTIGSYDRARWVEADEVFTSFETWLNTTLPKSGATPLTIMSRRPPAATVPGQQVVPQGVTIQTLPYVPGAPEDPPAPTGPPPEVPNEPTEPPTET